MYFSLFSIFAIVSIGQVFGHIYENTFEQDIAISALHLSQAAYCMTHNSNWDCITCDSSNKLDFVLEEHNELVIQGYNSDTDSLFVSFRGSVNIPNWIDNIQISKINPYVDKNIGVHNGLYHEYLLYKERLFSYVQGLDENDSLIITGHSSGSGVGSFLAYDLVLEGVFLYSNINLYTFGSPRIGNKEFVNSFLSFDIQRRLKRVCKKKTPNVCYAF